MYFTLQTIGASRGLGNFCLRKHIARGELDLANQKLLESIMCPRQVLIWSL